MLIFSLKLLLAHILGDFFLQPEKWVTNRKQHGIKSVSLYFHVVVHLLLLIILLYNDLSSYWIGILTITISHFIIDLLKVYLDRYYKTSQLKLFITDQLLHLFVLIFVADLYFSHIITAYLFSVTTLCYLIAFLIIVSVSPIFLKLFFAKWYDSLKKNDKSLDTDSLKDAGKYIGILERVLIVIFINMGFFEGIGYLLAAKSIFRFGDLTRSRDKKLTEYILLGTLISFCIAIITGLCLRELLKLI
ncbi:DUF3307 domain-containing protein [Pseudopedobacter beijingensis]|uniref:DUF3307 domain-containing protein n=1 Tax=Pseudopedobacter beijingensis TaxID=1207056 RepID=A0ABW4IIM1_9SPHI